MSVKEEKAIRIVPQVKSINLVFTAVLIFAASALISMPQMIGSANAQSERASERACPSGFTLERGECTAEPTGTKLICDPSTVAGMPATLTPFTQVCRATIPFGGNFESFSQACDEIEGSLLRETPGGFACDFRPTEAITCPGGVTPTEQGECITKPGRGNDPTR